jgi:hypothetical protein
MKRCFFPVIILLALLAGAVLPAVAQDSKQYVKHGTGAPAACAVGTVYVDDSTGNVYANRLGSCQLVGTSTPGGSSGQLQYNNAGAFGGFTLGGDCTISAPNVTCTKSGGTSFGSAAFASINSTNNRLAKRSSATAFTDSLLSDDGTNTMLTSGQFIAPVGAVGTPTFAFTGFTNTGMYTVGGTNVRLAVGGAQMFSVNSTGASITGTQVGIGSGAATLEAEAPNTLALRNGTNAQTQR